MVRVPNKRRAKREREPFRLRKWHQQGPVLVVVVHQISVKKVTFVQHLQADAALTSAASVSDLVLPLLWLHDLASPAEQKT